MLELLAIKGPGGGQAEERLRPPDLSVHFTRTLPDDAAGHTADLSKGEPIGPDSLYLLVVLDGPRWIVLDSLSGDDRDKLVSWLVGAKGKLSLDGTVLVIGESRQEVTFDADTIDPLAVLAGADSREQDAAFFDFLNGGETVLDAEDADHSGWKKGQTKPGAWYDHYKIEGGVVVGHRSGFDGRDEEIPNLDLDGLESLIMRCLDVGGVRAALGDDKGTFIAAFRGRFADGHPQGEQGLVALCNEIWSYLTTGAGQDGRVDIGRLQAVVRALSPDTATTATTNTTFEGKTFVLPGMNTELPRGDEKFGRATMMELMHLIGGISRTLIEPHVVQLNDGFDERDQFVSDRSPSMVGKWAMVEEVVDQDHGWTSDNGVDSRTVGKFDHAGAKVGGTNREDLAEALRRAWQRLFPNDGPSDRQAFADLFDLQEADIFDRGGLAPDKLMRLLGDGPGGDYGGTGESTLKAMLMVLTHPEDLDPNDPLRQRIEKGPSGTDPVRLNGVADEPEQGLEYLDLVQALARTLHVDARIIAVPTRKVDFSQTDPVGDLVLVDLEDIVINGDGTVTMTWTQGGREQTGRVPMDQEPSGNPRKPFDDASLKLHPDQKLVAQDGAPTR